MKFVAIEKRQVVVELDPEEAYYLSLACELASLSAGGSVPRESPFPEHDTDVMYLFENLTAAFEASAIAGATESQVTDDAAEKLTLANLRSGLLLKPLGLQLQEFLQQKGLHRREA